MNLSLDQKYQDALDYIYSFVDFSLTHQENLSPENFDLSRMVQFLEELGNPQDEFPSIHVAGSKGKGSVSAMCASVLQQAGYQVGLYTSPHLKDFEERIQVNRVSMDRSILVEYVAEIKPAVTRIPGLTTFEIMTALGFLYFARQQVDIAVVEVGLGGRLDATNVIIPLVSVITSLYLDHVSILGDTLDKIAREKGGIIKTGIPVVCAPQKQIALDVIREISESRNAPLIEIGRDYRFEISSRSLEGQEFLIEEADRQINLSIPLVGDFQVINAVTAYAALDSLPEKDFSLQEEAIRQGFQDTAWPARFEVLRRDPPLVIDSAHNPASIGKLRETVDEFFPGRPMILVFGISEDKQLDGMLAEILPRTSYLITTQADHPRAMDAFDLAQRAGSYDCQVEAIPEVREALEKALELAADGELVLVAGSIFVAASARIAWLGED
ncbi:MAG: bifunctional folylpolyglutamate synthase/dihydrofolate synthase [Anaerolineales bacterium]